MSSISNSLDLDRLCILTTQSIPYMLIAFDFEDTLDYVIPAALKIYPDQSYQDLVESNCFIIRQTMDYLLNGEKRGVGVEEIREYGLYSVIMIPQGGGHSGHEFMLVVEQERAFILHSYIGHFKARYRVLDRNDRSLLITLLSRVMNNDHTIDDLTIYNNIFEVNEFHLSDKFTVYVDYYGDTPNMGEVERNHVHLVELSLHSRKTGEVS